MEFTFKKEVTVKLKTLKVKAGARHWEDASINGEADENGELCRLLRAIIGALKLTLKPGK